MLANRRRRSLFAQVETVPEKLSKVLHKGFQFFESECNHYTALFDYAPSEAAAAARKESLRHLRKEIKKLYQLHVAELGDINGWKENKFLTCWDMKGLWPSVSRKGFFIN